MFKSIVLLVLILVGCGVETSRHGFECGAVEKGLYGSETYGIHNELEAKCQAEGGQCLPSEDRADSPVYCVLPTGFECAATTPDLFKTAAEYEEYNALESKCQASGGECLPSKGTSGPVYCVSETSDLR